MTSNDIRYQPLPEMPRCDKGRGKLDDMTRIAYGIFWMLREIAAQLAELNETGKSHGTR